MKLLAEKMEAMRFMYHPLLQKLMFEKSRLLIHIKEMKELEERRYAEKVQDNEKLNKYRNFVVDLYYKGKITDKEIKSMETLQ